MGSTYILRKGVATLGDLQDGYSAYMGPGFTHFYVDKYTGSDSNSGLGGFDEPFATIDAACDAANARIDWSNYPQRYSVIWVSPGAYAEAPSPPFMTHIIGLGIMGTDSQTKIVPATGSVFTGTFLGTGLHNLFISVNEAVPCLDLGVCNDSLVEDCTFANGAAVGATAVDTENSAQFVFRNNTVTSGEATGMAYGLYHRGGANKYLHAATIENNRILCTTAGIYIASNCTASQTVIAHNLIARPVKGIDDNNGNTYCYDNWITASSDAIEHANSTTHCIGNHVINNVTGAVEASGTD